MAKAEFREDSVLWHHQSAHESLCRLGVGPSGLTEDEAAARLSRLGPNRIPVRPPPPPWRRFLRQFNNALIYVLLGAAGVTAALGYAVDTGVIIGVVLINAVVGYIQEGRAEQAMAAIRRLLAPSTTVLRDGSASRIDAQRVVEGDIVILRAGDRVPADLRLIESRELRIDEALLTGESAPAAKETEPVAENAALADRSCLCYSGTLVTRGWARGVVFATGARTEVGRVSALLEEVEELTTPLLRKMEDFGRWLSLLILVLSTGIGLYGVFVRNLSPVEMLLAAVGIAVAAIPEGLPPVITITLAIGVQRMAARSAIVRRLPAVETLGEVNTICTDKTGTLTRNEMTVRSVRLADAEVEVTGGGYAPEGELLIDGKPFDIGARPALTTLLRTGLLCNEGRLRRTESEWQPEGDPTEVALLTLAAKGGLRLEAEAAAHSRLDMIPFSSASKLMATSHRDPQGDYWIHIKGAPERLLDRASSQRRGAATEPLDKAYWQRQIEELASQGQRVLALAVKPVEPGEARLRPEDIDRDLSLLGLVGVSDPPRAEVADAVRECRGAGIRVKMITGDHAGTALAIARELGLDAGSVLTGADVDQLDDAALRDRVTAVDVYARTAPEHKLRLVKALQANGEVVAMTGDGVNDAPALKRADIGVAMGRKGTEAAKEAAEMVLADDNFATIVHAVEEGRTLYDNIRKAVLFLLPTALAEALVVGLAILFGSELPLTPVQILWVNMITAVTLGLALSFEPAEAGIMARPPRRGGSGVLTPFVLWRNLYVAALLVTGTVGLFVYERASGAPLDTARTISVDMLVLFEALYLLNCRHFTAPILTREGLLANRYVPLSIAAVMAFQVLFTYAPPFQAMFASDALTAQSWLRIVLVAAAVTAAIELEKALIRHFAAARHRDNSARIPHSRV